MEEDGVVHVPAISRTISEDEYEDLCVMIDPMARSNNYGIGIYVDVLHCFAMTVLFLFIFARLIFNSRKAKFNRIMKILSVRNNFSLE